MYSSIACIINSINNKKKVILLRYRSSIYTLLQIMEKEFKLIQISFIFKQWVFVKLSLISPSKKMFVKMFNLKSKRSFCSYKKLKKYITYTSFIIVYSPKGLCSAKSAVQEKTGGILYSIIY